MKVINLFGGPGSGKSTTATGVFFLAKCAGVMIEYVPEWVKPFAYTAKKDGRFPSQMEILHHQASWLSRFEGSVDWVITDSPIAMQLAYTDNRIDREAIKAIAQLWPTVDILVERVKPYAPYGRSQSEDAAKRLDERIRREHGLPWDMTVAGDATGPSRILEGLSIEQAS